MDQTTGPDRSAQDRDGQQIAAAMWRRTADGAWQIFHHQGTLAAS